MVAESKPCTSIGEQLYHGASTETTQSLKNGWVRYGALNSEI